MGHERMGEFEELVMLSIAGLRDEAYSVTIQQKLEEEADRSVPLGAILSALNRLERKGLVKSWTAQPTVARRGRPMRMVQLTDDGTSALEESYRVRVEMYRSALELNPELKLVGG